MSSRPVLDVAIVLIRRNDRILVRQRLASEHLPGVWEFPGGKVREGEAPLAAAIRELREEMGLAAGALRPLETIEHDYEDRRVRLFVFEGEANGDAVTADGAAWAWLTPAELAGRPIPPANRVLVHRLATLEKR